MEAHMTQQSVLFVDDEANVLNALRRSLRKEEFAVYFAQGPEEAVDVLKENDIDVVVSDHLMPSMDGLSFLKMVKNLYPGIIRLLLTGHADLQMAIQAINEGEVFRFLTKPWNDIELKMTLKHVFEYIELRRENQLLLDTVQKQQNLIEKMEEDHPGIFKVKRDATGTIILDDPFEKA
jgi:DNA-binding NtrC family response regulator